ncbi:MAG: FimV/HubP family polar landmark protein [Steroidobacteraceae bacterium]
MRVKFTVAAASLMVGLPATSFALGLGEIQLRSSLNAPLDAQIELLGATAEELAGLRAQIASRETFTRYGLDYPSFLANVQVRFIRNETRPYIELRSSAPITEPFATLLVEVNYPRGRQVREYTVLLDPPVFAPQNAAAAAPVAAPVTGEGQRSGEIARQAAPAPAPAPVAANPAPARPAPSAPVQTSTAAGGTYEVRRGDSLSKIAATVVGPGQQQQRRAMIAIYRGNPEAFDGNINLLRSGAILRLPDGAAIDGVDAAEASAEVRRQSANWLANRQGAPAEGGGGQDRLRLVPPGDAPSNAAGTGAAATGAGAAAAGGNADLQRRVDDLERQLSESRRLLDLRNAELARLQGTPPPAATPAPVAPPAATAPTPAPAPVAPEPAAPAPAAEAPPATPPPAAAAPAAPAEESGGLLALLKTYWYAPVALLALLLAFLGLGAARRRREANLDASLGLGGGLEPGYRDASADTLPLRKPNITGEDESRSFVVEESGTHERPAFAGGSARTTQRVEVDEPGPIDIPLVDQTASLDQGDPLAEADFHMAYGLYDQAADLVRLALQREPGRRDLRLKLLEVFFVWGNREQFLQTARDLASSRDQAQPGEWEKVVIMGKQLAPEDPLFTQGGTGAAVGGVDLNLEGGQNRVDFDLLGEPGVELGIDGGIDLDLGAALRDKDPTGDALQFDPGTLDFPLDDPQRGADTLAHTATTRQMAQPLRGGDDSPTVNRIGAGHDGPTVEQPGLTAGETIRQKLDVMAPKFGADQTAELALDDLGLDLGALDETDQSKNLDDSRITRGLDSAEAPTLVAGLDDESRDLINAARGQSGDAPTMLAPAPDASASESGTWLFDDKSFLDQNADTSKADGNVTQAIPFLPDAEDASPTSKLRAIEGNLDVDFDVDSLAATGRNESLSAADSPLDLDVGMPEPSETGTFQQTQRLQHDELALPMELEPATMSEVGTKLDLARAYMDMGDPEGARSILFEVLEEGSNNQKTEAQRLLDSIPG